MWLPIVLLIVTIVFYLYVKTNTDEKRVMKRIRAETSYPIFGHALTLGTGGAGLYNGLMRMWKSANMETFRLDLGPLSIAVISNAENVEALLSSQTHIDKLDEFYEKVIPWLGRGLLISSGDRWRTHRKIITPAFHFKILENYVEIFQHEARILGDKLSKYSSDKDINIHPLVALAAFSGICETAMGIKVYAQEKESNYMQAVEEMCKISFARLFSWYKRNDYVFPLTYSGYRQRHCLKIIREKTDSVINLRRQKLLQEVKVSKPELKENDDSHGFKNRRAFLDLLLMSIKEDGQPLTDQDIKDEVNTFIFEGQDTTTSCIAFTFYALSQNLDVQNKILEEQKQILGDDLSRNASYSEINEMKYLDKVIKESMRIYPPVPMYGRTLVDNLVLPDGTQLPKKGKVLVAPMLMHLNPKLYPEPEKFDPERFADSQKRNPFAFVPFSAGPRNCIGQKFAMIEIKAYLSIILRMFLIEPTPGFKPIIAPEVTLKSQNGLLLRVKPRKYI